MTDKRIPLDAQYGYAKVEEITPEQWEAFGDALYMELVKETMGGWEESSVVQKIHLDAQQIIKDAVKVMEQAFYEFNAIKARDGAPQHIDWYRGQPLQTDSCCHKWWAEVTESLKTNLQALKGLIDD